LNAQYLSRSQESANEWGRQDPKAIRKLVATVGNKWSIFLVLALADLLGHRARFCELERAIPAISQKMLTLTLRQLERDGVVTRELFAEVPPRVEYQLTPLGLSLLEPMRGLVDWVSANWEHVRKAHSQSNVREGRMIGDPR
jgi:DNA-binding HxlR family transcriptional regulator